jgi:hypothetical protein
VYRPAPGQVDALKDAFGSLATLRVPLTSVLQHGDPHPGNLLLDSAGRVLVLDWESAEPHGMPLWDLAYFFRAYAVAASRQDGSRDRLHGATRHLLDSSALSERLVAAVDADLAATGLPRAAVRPLLLGCWLHRALKEATRTLPDRLWQGQSVQLLTTMLSRPGAATLRRLEEGPPA